jgi:outer membrane protein assembly factor BamB
VVGTRAVFVCDGANVLVFDRPTQRLIALAPLDLPADVNPSGQPDGRVLPGDDPHKMLPLLEGHALTLDERRDGSARLYVACCRRLQENRTGRERLPDSALAAYAWNGTELERLWRVGGTGTEDALPAGLSLHGAPCVYRGLAWVAGARPTEATADRLEAWLVALDEGGRPVRQVHLGSGSPVRAGRMDEAVPSSPAAARGRVVVSTSLGFVAAVDAEDGRLAWIYRYDRGLETGRARRLGSDEEDATQRLTGFANEPPVLAFELTLVAPTDSNYLYGLGARPRGPQRDLERWWPKDRRSVFGEIAVEYVAGVVGGSGDVQPQVILVGKGDSGDSGVPGKVIVGLEPLHGFKRWAFPAATGRGSVPHGRAVVTEREAFLPTRHGLLVIDLAGLLEGGAPAAAARPSERPFLTGPPSPAPRADLFAGLAYGNLVPLPGEGLIAVNNTHVTFWTRK